MKVFKFLMFLALADHSLSALTEAQQKELIGKNYEACKNFPYRPLSEIANDIDERRADRDNHFFAM